MSFPEAKVWFQCLVPLPIQHKFSSRNVEQYNSMLFEVCEFKKIYFLDVFDKFLTYNPIRRYYFRNENFYIDSSNVHLNRQGMSILARAYLKCIHSDRFNPLGF